MLRSIGNRLMRKYYTSTVMRLVAHLKINLNQLATPEEGTDLEHYIQPKYFDEIIKAALLGAKQESNDEEDLRSPSNAIKLP